MKFKSVFRSIRRGHLTWIENTLTQQYELFRRIRGGRVEFFGMYASVPVYSCPPVQCAVSDETEGDVVAPKQSWARSILLFLESLFFAIMKTLKGKEK